MKTLDELRLEEVDSLRAENEKMKAVTGSVGMMSQGAFKGRYGKRRTKNIKDYHKAKNNRI